MHLRPPVPFGLHHSLPRIALLVLLILLMAVLAPILRSQQTSNPPAPASPGQPRNSGTDAAEPASKADAIVGRLEGKQIFLRVFDLNNDLKFDENGNLLGTPQPGSFTLCAIDVKKVHVSKHRVEVEGTRMGLHFFGALPYEDDTRPFERIRLSKKPIHISIEREQVVIPKKTKDKDEKETAAAKPLPANGPFAPEASPAPVETRAETPAESAAGSSPQTGNLASQTTISPAHAAKLLNQAVDKVFAERIDESFVRTLPQYWQHYFAAKAAGSDVAASTSGIARPGPEVLSPKVLSSLEPGSNEFAQKYNIAGVSLFRTIIDPQGHPEVVAVARPLGFGLDERAVDAIQKASFQPGVQAGKPVPVIVDLVVTFRIYSNRTRGSAVEPVTHPETQKDQVAANP
jgi:outer membrane biosynthesis protein TonB